MTVADLFLSLKDVTDRGITFIYGDSTEVFLSYADLFRKALGYLGIVQDRGVNKGDKVIFQIDDNLEFVSMFWAALLGGIVPVPVIAATNPEQRKKVYNIYKKLDGPFIVATGKQSSLLDFASDEKLLLIESMSDGSAVGQVRTVSPEDTAFIQFSSGSTGDPKGVVLTHENLVTNVRSIVRGVDSHENDTTLSWMPLTHDMELIGFHLAPVSAGINHYLIPTSLFIRRPMLWMKKVSEHRVSITASPNFGYKHFLRGFSREKAAGWDLSCLKVILNGAEPVAPEPWFEFFGELEGFGLLKNVVFPVYGLAEASLAVTFPPLSEELKYLFFDRNSLGPGDIAKKVDKNHRSAVACVDLGFPVENTEVAVVDLKSGQPEEDRVGIIAVKGKSVTPGYYEDREATKAVFTDDGWLNTGDLGVMRSGRLYVTGRYKDIIFINGQNYYPHDIETVLEDMPGVEPGKIAVAGVFSKELDRDEIVAFVVYKKKLENFPGVSIAMKKHINVCVGIDLGNVVPVKVIPKTTSGKIMRFQLASRYENGEFDEVLSKVRAIQKKDLSFTGRDSEYGKVEEYLKNLWKKVTDIKDIGSSDNFFELGGSSIMLAEIQSELEKEYPGRVSLTDLFAYPSISQLSKFISDARGVGATEQSLIEYHEMPDHFFGGGDFEGENRSFGFTLPGEVLSAAEKIAESEKVEEKDFFLALFLYVVSSLSGKENIGLQTNLSHPGRVTPCRFDLSGVSDLSSLFLLTWKERAKSEKNISLNVAHISGISFEADRSKASFLFSTRECASDIRKLLSLYDIVVQYEKGATSGDFSFEYNWKRIEESAVRELAEKFTGTIESVVEQYN